MFRQVKFALDGAVFAGEKLFLRDEVNAHVADFAFQRKLIPHPDVGKPVLVGGIKFKVAANEALETVPQFAVGNLVFPELRQNVVDGLFRHAVGLAS